MNNKDVFWVSNPLTLFEINSLNDLWPNRQDSVNKKLNAVTRIIIVMNVIGLMIMSEKRARLLITTALTILVIVLYQRYDEQSQSNVDPQVIQESFDNPEQYLQTRGMYKEPTVDNPYMNVQMGDINENPSTKPAAPAYNPIVKKEINDSVKSNLDSKLFKDLGDEIEFEVSQRQFYTTANSMVPNDQKGFANFCYGNLASDKENSITQYCK